MTGRYIINDGNENELSNAIIQMIKSTQDYIKISSFLMQDAKITEMLMDVSKSGKVAVFIISNKKDQESEEYIESNIISENSNKNVGFDNHARFLKELFYSGIHVRLLDNLHAKFVISDGNKGLIMSANLSPNSLKRNIETGVEIFDDDVKELEYVFDLMYNHADIVKFQGANKKDITVKVNNKLDPKSLETVKGNIRLTVGSSTDTNLKMCNTYTIYDTIINIINNAKKYVYIVSWHFKLKDDSLQTFVETIRSARRRGVEVYLYSNTLTRTPSLSLSLKAIRLLTSMGCKSYGDDKNHSKCILSESEGMLFTANIDSVSGMKSGFEVGCILNRTQRNLAKQHIINLITKNGNDGK